jgi:hypothetical protein
MTRRPVQRFTTTAVTMLAAIAVTGLGCANGEFRFNDPIGREKALEAVQKEYTSLVRWNEFDQAAQFVHPDARAEFLAEAPGEDLRFTDAETKPIEIDEELASANVQVTYLAYNRHSPYEYKVEEDQAWEREGTTWSVRPTFDGLRKAAGKPE